MSRLNEYHPSRFHGIWALTKRELKKWLKEPIILLMAILQPVLWMGLFGKAMNLGNMFSSSNISISDIVLPGVALIPPQSGSITISGTALSQMFANFGPTIMQNIFGVKDYFSYMSVGMISFIVMFTTMFSGMSIVWDRRRILEQSAQHSCIARSNNIFKGSQRISEVNVPSHNNSGTRSNIWLTSQPNLQPYLHTSNIRCNIPSLPRAVLSVSGTCFEID